MTELNCEFSLFPSPFLAAYLVGAHPRDRGTPNICPASPLWLPGPPHRGLDRSLTGRGQLRTPFRHKGAEALFWAGLRGQISHASSCHQAHPTFSSPQKESFRDPDCPPPQEVASPPQALYAQSLAFGWSSWPQVSMLYLLPLPQSLVGAWSVAPLTWTFHLCGPR